MAAAWRRAQRRRSSARVMRVVATDRTTVAARIAAMVHGGRCAGTVAGGGGGIGATAGVGGAEVAAAAGARPIAAAGQTASPPSPASVLGMRRGCAGAGWWFIWGGPFGGLADVSLDGLVCCPH